jgi:hypothetical protein
MNYLKKVLWMLTVPVSSLLGYYFLKCISIKSDLEIWKKSFSEKKVLIVGTGPSLDRVNDNYFSKFDTILYINHAVKLAGKKTSNEYFFSTDINIAKNIKKTDYYHKILQIGSKKSIIAPIFFQQILSLKQKDRGSFSWIAASNAMYKKHKLNRSIFGLNFPITTVYWPQQPKKKQLDEWYLKKDQVIFFPVIESTSALSAILFIAKYRPYSVSLIGCDFSVGRSELIVNNKSPAYTVNVFSESRGKFLYLQSYLRKIDIVIENDSWATENNV